MTSKKLIKLPKQGAQNVKILLQVTIETKHSIHKASLMTSHTASKWRQQHDMRRNERKMSKELRQNERSHRKTQTQLFIKRFFGY